MTGMANLDRQDWAYVAPELPYTDYHVGERPVLRFLPAGHGVYELDIRSATIGRKSLILKENRYVLPGDMLVGDYVIRVRWNDNQDESSAWTGLSMPLRLRLHAQDQDIGVLQQRSHRLSLLCMKDPLGSVTSIDPDGTPPGYAGHGAGSWFPTRWYEGRTGLFNEDEAYYRDPLAYLAGCLDVLKSRGACFVTWRDVMQGTAMGQGLEVLIQLDVDGGARSLQRVAGLLLTRDIRASVQVHRAASRWYRYRVMDDNLVLLRQLVQAGWEIGYHNNALSEVLAGSDLQELSEALLEKATQRFRRDVMVLRSWFDVDIYTNHGGNTPNHLVKPPDNLGLTPVDSPLNPSLWRAVRSSSSDGGFLAAPCPLRNRVESLHEGLHFLRLHPFKYGNYGGLADQPPRHWKDWPALGLEEDEAGRQRFDEEAGKERRWLAERRSRRMAVRLAYEREARTISSRFRPLDLLKDKLEHFLGLRGEKMHRQYPWVEADPRVVWWRMLDAWGPERGEVLNVGTLPPARHGETRAFLQGDVKVTEMDIDPTWEPDILGDVVEAPVELNGRFSATLLMGLPFFACPSEAVGACHRLTEEGGSGLFAFASDTHPQRGGLWNPATRLVWRKEREPLVGMGLREKLWSFDDQCTEELFSSWSSILAEPVGHHWFVVARK